jgi:hypothetical protein
LIRAALTSPETTIEKQGWGMATNNDAASAEATWLPVIGRTLAFLCMKEAERTKKFDGVLDRVAFLEGLGLPAADAASAAGSSKASVDELRRLQRNRKTDVKKTTKKKRR